MVLASIAVHGKTSEITRFAPLLDQINGLRDTVITADALHRQHEHVTYLAERGAHWILTRVAVCPSLTPVSSVTTSCGLLVTVTPV